MNSVISSAKDSAEHAADTIQSDIGGTVKVLVAFGTQVLRFYNQARAVEMPGVDNVLHSVGLQRRANPLVPVLLFAAGAAIAGGAALVLAPTSGRELRRKLGVMLTNANKSDLVKTVVKEVKEMEDTIESAVTSKKPGDNDHMRTS